MLLHILASGRRVRKAFSRLKYSFRRGAGPGCGDKKQMQTRTSRSVQIKVSLEHCLLSKDRAQPSSKDHQSLWGAGWSQRDSPAIWVDICLQAVYLDSSSITLCGPPTPSGVIFITNNNNNKEFTVGNKFSQVLLHRSFQQILVG